MEPVSASLAAINLIMNQINSANSQTAALSNLQFQKDQAREGNRMAQATRTDAYGNQQSYDPATNTWKTTLTPMQLAIQKAGESEQFRSLTEDAQRNRDLRKRQATMSEDAVKPYNDAVQQFTNMQPKSEGAINDQLQTLMLQANQDQGKEGQAGLLRQSLRLGRGGDIPSIIKSTDDKLGQGVSSTMLKALQGAHTQHQGDVQAHNSEFLPVIQQLQKTIDDGGGSAAQRFSDVPAQMANMENNQASGMLNALSNGASAINNANRSVITSTSKNLDFAPMIKALSAYSKKGTDDSGEAKTDFTQIPKILEDLKYGRPDIYGSDSNFSF